jgi:hypothetical protein
METDPAKDPFMDNALRLVVLLAMGYLVFIALNGIIERILG